MRKETRGDIEFGEDALGLIKRVSVERQVLEHTGNLSMVKADFEWNELTSIEDLEKFSYGNKGPAVALNCEDSFIVNKSDTQAVVVSGIRDAVIVNTDDAVFVGARGRSSEDDLKNLLVNDRTGTHKIDKYINGSNTHYKEYVDDQVALKANPTGGAKTYDQINAKLNSFTLGVALEFSKSVKAFQFNAGVGLLYAIGGGSMSFDYGNELLEEFGLDPSVELRTDALAGCKLLRAVYSVGDTPPHIPGGDPFPDKRADAVLYVPAGAAEAYATAEYWNTFSQIVELEEFPEWVVGHSRILQQ